MTPAAASVFTMFTSAFALFFIFHLLVPPQRLFSAIAVYTIVTALAIFIACVACANTVFTIATVASCLIEYGLAWTTANHAETDRESRKKS
tara:strand:- start:585 stop:857 length:273 start_codon:yes stop_codon:yes gene_type:complete